MPASRAEQISQTNPDSPYSRSDNLFTKLHRTYLNFLRRPPAEDVRLIANPDDDRIESAGESGNDASSGKPFQREVPEATLPAFDPNNPGAFVRGRVSRLHLS
ncbi:hypothetical protein L21_0800 [Methanoculleus chikugoensis]|jgi:hypothetical protein|uniref:Uncharacterized protein n=1 Tax=Methanoculleus chikugoensis TaxID=118126 RepID=A0A1M4MJ57_9EURY|nr:hypothetical protein L21_0800 [Methanoculleus chikugoensis]